MTNQITVHKSKKSYPIAVRDITFAREVSDEDRANVQGKYPDIDASSFNTVLHLGAEKKPFMITETLGELAAMGVQFINAGHGRFAPAAYIAPDKPPVAVTQEDLDRLAGNHGELARTFRSEVYMVNGGKFWSPATPEQVVARKVKALDGGPAATAE